MYLGMIAVIAGVAVLLGTATPMLVLPMFAGVLGLKFVPAEEKRMALTFGENWEAYARRVRKWL